MPAVTRETLLGGYRQAVGRFEAARPRTEPWEQAFFALFEALNWAVALDDHLDRGAGPKYDWRTRYAGGDIAGGLRLARNRVHHAWADALVEELDVTTATYGGATWGSGTWGGQWRWLWRPLHELPKGKPSDRPDNVAVYKSQLAGADASGTLAALLRAFEAAVSRP